MRDEQRTALRGRLGIPELLVLAGLVLLGLALRLPSFNDSLWGDEISTNYTVNGFGVGSVIHIVLSDQEGTPPLFFLLTWLTKGFDDVEGLRVVSLLAGLGAIPLTYLVGTRTLGERPAFVGATLVALSPFQIFYATEARAYELMMFFCLLAALLLLVAIDRGRPGWWMAYGLAVAAAAYTHYTSVFVLLALLAWALIARPQVRRPVVLANLGAALLYVPWIPELLNDRHEPAAQALELLHRQTLHSTADDLVHWSLGHPFIPIATVPGHLALWLMAAAALVGSLALVLRWRASPAVAQWPRRSDLILIVLLALAAPVGAKLQGAVGADVFSPRNSISSWPFLALLAGVLVAVGAAPWRAVATGLLLAAFAIGGIKMLDVDNQRPDYAGAVSYIEGAGPPNSPVVDTYALTPGAQTAVEAAFAPKGEPYPRGREVLTLDFPTLEERLRIRKAGMSIVAPQPKPSAVQIAHQAGQAAGPSGTIFVITGRAPLDLLRRDPGPLADFLNALPPRYQEVDSRDFPGLTYSGIRVDVLRGAGPSAGRE